LNKLKAPKLHPSITENPLVQAVRGELPVVRPLTTYWLEIVRARRDRELYVFLNDVAQAIEDLRQHEPDRLDVTHIDSDDFSETLGNITELAIREQDETKRSYLRRFVVNYGTCERPDITLRKVFYQIIAELSGLHLVLLDKVFEAQKSISDEDLRVLAEQLDRHEALSIHSLKEALLIKEDLVAVLAATLESKGLLHIKTPGTTIQDHTPRLIMCPLTKEIYGLLAGEVELRRQNLNPDIKIGGWCG